MVATASGLSRIVKSDLDGILKEWMQQQVAALGNVRSLLDENSLREDSRNFLGLLSHSMEMDGQDPKLNSSEWKAVHEFLDGLSRRRARLGYSPSETATFIFSLKQPIFARIFKEQRGNPEALASDTWRATTILDQLGLFTTEVYLKGREEMINRQQRDLLELSTPVVELWEGILALPLIGTLDSARTQVVMESLLQKIVESESSIAIIDITGVPTVDSMVAQHLLKTVAAARLMGADCIISGIRPQIAQTMVHLGLDLAEVATKASLAAAFSLALERTGATIARPTARH
jgi:rsbT co-antagonist protein RsbR